MPVFVIILLGNCHFKLTNKYTVIVPMDAVLLNFWLTLNKRLPFELEVFDVTRANK